MKEREGEGGVIISLMLRVVLCNDIVICYHGVSLDIETENNSIE